MSDVFPRRNLPPEAEAWGREVERENRRVSQTLLSHELGIPSGNRAMAGQMGAVGRQITDLRSRTTQVTEIGRISAPLSIPGDYGMANRRHSQSITIPPPFDGVNRKALVFVSGIAYNSDPTNAMGTVYVRIGDIVSRPMAAPAMSSTPVGYIETFSLATVLQGGSGFLIDFLLIGSNNTTSARTVQLGVDNVTVVSVYGDEVKV